MRATTSGVGVVNPFSCSRQNVSASDQSRLADSCGHPQLRAGELGQFHHRFHRIGSARTRASGNTGLGLAIARAIVEAHGGTIAAGESPEGGARVAIELPGFAAVDEPAELPEMPVA